MKAARVLLAFLALATVFAPAAAAVCTSGPVSMCVGESSVPSSAGGTFHAQWAYPATVTTDASVFVVTVNIDTSATAQTLVLPPGNSWTYVGCSYTSETVATVAGVVKTAIVRATMTSPVCTISFQPSTSSAGGTTTSILSVMMRIVSMSVPQNLALSGTVNTPLSGTVNTPLSGTVVLDGGVGVDILDDSTDDGQLTVPTGTTYTENQTLNMAFPGTLTITETTQNEWVPIFLWFFAMVALLKLHKAAAAFAALLGLLHEFVPAMPGDRVLYLLLFAIMLWMEAVAGDRLYARWLKGPRGSETP